MLSDSTAIIRKGSADEIVAKRDRALDLYRRGVELLAEAVKVHREVAGTDHVHLSSVLDRGGTYSIEQGRHAEVVENLRRDLDGSVWNHIMGALGLLNLMDAQAMTEFREQNEKAPPEVTRDNLVATFERLTADSDALFRRGVINLFQKLDRSFASNPAYRLGDKLVFTGALSEFGGWSHWNNRQAEMRDLDRIFHIMDGKAPKDHGGDASAMISATRKAPATVETDYFVCKLFKNRNLHVAFKRQDLVAKVNRIIAEHFGETLAHERPRRRRAA